MPDEVEGVAQASAEVGTSGCTGNSLGSLGEASVRLREGLMLVGAREECHVGPLLVAEHEPLVPEQVQEVGECGMVLRNRNIVITPGGS